jgi:uncharacterized membrane protein YeiH
VALFAFAYAAAEARHLLATAGPVGVSRIAVILACRPCGDLRSAVLKPAVLLAALAGGFLAHRLIQGHVPYLLARGLAAGLLVTIGVQKGIEYQAPADAAIFLGILNGTMGAATADVMAGERAAIFRQAHWGLAAVVSSAFIFWLLTTYVGFWIAIVAAVLTVTSLDTLSVKLGWNSLMFPGDRED